MSSAGAAVGVSDPRAGADRQSVVAASLAAIAESGVIFLPLRQFLEEDARAHGGPLATYPLFVALFVAGTAWATLRRRRSHTMPIVAAGAVVLTAAQVLVWGSAEMAGGLFAGVLVLLVTMRLLTLAHRDWQDPIGESFVLGTVVLLLEVATASTFGDTWRALLVVVVPQFFLGSLGSRAASVRLSTRPPGSESLEDAGGARRVRGAVVGMAALGALMGLAALLGREGGSLELIGRLLYLALSGVLVGVAFVFARVIVPPVVWLLERLHIHFDFLRRFAQRARFRVTVPDTINRGPQTGWIRIAGFLILMAMFVLLLRAIRRRWYRAMMPELRVADRPEPPARSLSPSRGRTRRSGRAPRWEPPADTVRRWYAEALLILEGRGLVKAPSRTPGEFAPEVARAFPDSAHSFDALTRAYEQVRYGSVTIERGQLARLADQRLWALDVFRRGERKDQTHDQSEA